MDDLEIIVLDDSSPPSTNCGLFFTSFSALYLLWFVLYIILCFIFPLVNLNAKSLTCMYIGSASKFMPEQVPLTDLENVETTVSITVIGASGDLAKKKIFPALFALFYEDCLPEVKFRISNYIVIY